MVFGRYPLPEAESTTQLIDALAELGDKRSQQPH